MTEKRLLLFILGLYFLLGFIYALTTPVFEASDELWHYPMVRHLADGNPLPVQVMDPALAGPWKQEASQPPLYYYLGAALTFWIDTSDMEEVRLENPHVDNGLITKDGNINLIVHDPQANPWQGTLLAVRIVRLASVLLGGITVYITYRIGKEVSGNRAVISLGAAAVNAFIPMFLFISGAVNNDNLAIMLASLAILLMIRQVTKIHNLESVKEHKQGSGEHEKISLWSWVLLGVVVGAGLLTKEGTFGLLPIAWGTAFVATWLMDAKLKDNGEATFQKTLLWVGNLLLKSLFYFLLILIPAVLIAGWWYYRNLQLYGDLLGWNAFIAVLGQRGHPASLLQLWGERQGFLMAFWGLFGGVNVPMPTWIYSLLNAILGFSLFGFIVYIVQILKYWWNSIKNPWNSLRGVLNNLMNFVIQNFALVVSFLMAAAVIIGLIQWATTTWSSQGRLVFTALSPLAVLFVVGLVGWMPERAAKFIISLVAGFMMIISFVAPFLWIKPAYDPTAYQTTDLKHENNLDLVFGESFRLNRIAITGDENQIIHPGDFISIHLDWETLIPIDRDWSVFVHLVDPIIEQPIAQRDMYLGQGLLLTSWLDPGRRITNTYHIQIPETAIAPVELEIIAGLYDFKTGERLPMANGSDAVVIGKIAVDPSSGLVPNPTDINFEDQLTLIGYQIGSRRLEAGENIELTLFWQAKSILNSDYTFFAQVVDEDTTRWASQDHAPPEGSSKWLPNQIQTMSLNLTLSSETPAGLYPIIIGAYTQPSEDTFDRLQIMTDDGRLTDDFLILTQVRID